jgi:hypothetical protein
MKFFMFGFSECKTNVFQLSSSAHSTIIEVVNLLTLRANCHSRLIEFEAVPILPYPTDLPRGIAHQQSIGWHFFGNHGTSTNERVSTNRISANNGSIRPNTGSFSHMRFLVLPPTNNRTARIDHVGKYAGWAEKNVISANHSGINGDIVLDLYVPA